MKIGSIYIKLDNLQLVIPLLLVLLLISTNGSFAQKRYYSLGSQRIKWPFYELLVAMVIQRVCLIGNIASTG